MKFNRQIIICVYIIHAFELNFELNNKLNDLLFFFNVRHVRMRHMDGRHVGMMHVHCGHVVNGDMRMTISINASKLFLWWWGNELICKS